MLGGLISLVIIVGVVWILKLNVDRHWKKVGFKGYANFLQQS